MLIKGLGVELFPHPSAKRAAEGVFCAFAPFTREIPQDAGDKPIIRFIGNSSEEDRYGSVVSPAGARLKHFLANPVFMPFHIYDTWPLGRAVQVTPTASAISFDIEFAVNQLEEARIAYELYKADFVRGVSIGMIPLHWNEYEAKTIPIQYAENRIYDDWELLELSAAPIPANRGALKMALEAGVVTESGLRALHLEPYLREAPIELQTRVGKVLSRANEESLEQAVAQVRAAAEAIEKVLASAKKAEPAATTPEEPDPEDVDAGDRHVDETVERTCKCGKTFTIPKSLIPQDADLSTLSVLCDDCVTGERKARAALVAKSIMTVKKSADPQPKDEDRVKSYVDAIFRR